MPVNQNIKIEPLLFTNKNTKPSLFHTKCHDTHGFPYKFLNSSVLIISILILVLLKFLKQHIHQFF